MSAQLEAPTQLSLRLKTETEALHHKLNHMVMAANPFADREKYSRFVAAQYLFQRDLESLYDHPRMLALIPDLPTRPRLAAAAADLQDLDAPIPVAADEPAARQLDVTAGLGWLYVSEGSKLGAAFLFKEAGQRLGLSETLGARNLASPEGGRGAAWKRFTHVLDNSGFDEAQQDEVVAGARDAFNRFAELLDRTYGTAA